MPLNGQVILNNGEHEEAHITKNFGKDVDNDSKVRGEVTRESNASREHLGCEIHSIANNEGCEVSSVKHKRNR